MRRDLEESALARVEHLRHAVHRLRKELAVADNAKAPGPLSDQHVAAWKERDGPRLHQCVHDRDDAVVVMGGPENRVAEDLRSRPTEAHAAANKLKNVRTISISSQKDSRRTSRLPLWVAVLQASNRPRRVRAESECLKTDPP